MKLAELMNDDTCQILLAIIVGIFICYFIFGSCSSGSCSVGSCNRDGFSVGGEMSDECNVLVSNTDTNLLCGGTVDDTLDENDYITESEACCALLNTDTNRLCNASLEDWSELGENANNAKEQLAGLQSSCIEQGEEVDETQEKIDNLKKSMKTMLKKLRPTEVDAINSLDTIDTIIAYGNSMHFKFLIFENTGTGNKLFENNETLTNIVKNINIHDDFYNFNASGQKTSTDVELGNIYTIFRRLKGLNRTNNSAKVDIYCSNNTLTMGPSADTITNDKYDPLLKIRSTNMDNWATKNVCSASNNYSSINIESFTDDPSIQVLNQYTIRLKNRIDPNEEYDIDNYVNSIYNYDDGVLFNVEQKYNNKVITINSDNLFTTNPTIFSATEQIHIPQLIKLHVSNNVTISMKNTTSYNIEPGYYSILFMDGLSSEGSPYNNLLSVVGNGNKYETETMKGTSCVNTYYKNVFYLQYLILRLLFRTDKYLDADQEYELDIFKDLDPNKRDASEQTRGDDIPSTDNTACATTYNDYLVIGMINNNYIDPGSLTTTSSITESYINLNDNNGTLCNYDSEHSAYTITFMHPIEYIHGTATTNAINSIDCIEYYDVYDDKLGSYIDFDIPDGYGGPQPVKEYTNRYKTVDCSDGSVTLSASQTSIKHLLKVEEAVRFKKYYWLREGRDGGYLCEWQKDGNASIFSFYNNTNTCGVKLQDNTDWKYHVDENGKPYRFSSLYNDNLVMGTLIPKPFAAKATESTYLPMPGDYSKPIIEQKGLILAGVLFHEAFPLLVHYNLNYTGPQGGYKYPTGEFRDDDTERTIYAWEVDIRNPTNQVDGCSDDTATGGWASMFPTLLDSTLTEESLQCANSYTISTDLSQKVMVDLPDWVENRDDIEGQSIDYPSKCFYRGFAGVAAMVESDCQSMWEDSDTSAYFFNDDATFGPAICGNYDPLLGDWSFWMSLKDGLSNPGADILTVGSVLFGPGEIKGGSAFFQAWRAGRGLKAASDAYRLGRGGRAVGRGYEAGHAAVD